LEINLSDRKLRDSHLLKLVQHIDNKLEQYKRSSLEDCGSNIELDRNDLSDSALSALLKVMVKHKISLTVFSVFRNRITDLGAMLLADVLVVQQQECKELHISHNELTEQSLIALCLAIGRQKRPPSMPPCWVRIERNYIVDPETTLHYLQEVGNVWICAPQDQGCCRASCAQAKIYNENPKVHLYYIGSQLVSRNLWADSGRVQNWIRFFSDEI
jgi:hypothetical protein